jgi:Tfp pilus assembly protein PilW
MLCSGSSRNRSQGFGLVELLVSMTVLGFVLAIVGSILAGVQRNYLAQRQLIEANDNARAALDMLVRQLRMAGNNPFNVGGVQALGPNPNGSGILNSVRIQADWNPADGDLTDAFEDVTFSSSGGEFIVLDNPSATSNALLSRIGSLSLRCLNNAGAPTNQAGQVARIQITVQTQIPGMASSQFTSEATIRSRAPE